MNWKLIGALILGAGLVTACGAGQQEPASPAPGGEPSPEEAKPGMKRSVQPEVTSSPEGAAPTDGAAGGAPPSNTPGATSPNLQSQGAMIPERKDK